MPRTLPAQLESAMDSGVFKVYVAIGKRSPAATLITNILYYKYDGLQLSVKWASPNLPTTDGLDVGSKYYIERGVTIQGVNYTIKSCDLRFDDYTIERQVVTGSFTLFSSDEKPEAFNADISYENVINTVNPTGTGSYLLRLTAENPNHWGYQFYPDGKQLSLKSYQSFLALIRQKYLIEATDASDEAHDNYISYFHLGTPINERFWQEYTAQPFNAFAYSPSLQRIAAPAVGSFYYSSDGHTWTFAGSASGKNAYWKAAVWSPSLSLFVVVGDKTNIAFGNYTYCATSPDGVTWTSRTLISDDWRGLAWSEELGLFVAVGDGNFAYSSDGINWTTYAAPMSSHTVAWSAELGLFVTGSRFFAKSYSSPDGINWTENILPGGTRIWGNIAWSSTLGIFIGCSDDAGQLGFMKSSDGVTWTHNATPARPFKAIVWCEELSLFTALASDGLANAIYTSTDGTNWTQVLNTSTETWQAVGFMNDRITIVGAANINDAFVSLEAITSDHTITRGDAIIKKSGELQSFLWRDEAESIHTSGANTSLVHNLGYLESTDSPPASFYNSDRASIVTGIHLKYNSGDIFTIQINQTIQAYYFARVTEILDPNAEIGWRCEIDLIERFANTNAGSLPSTIERVAAYTPLVTTNFDGNLDATVNNLQAFADRVDDLVIYTQEEIEDFVGGMVTGNTEIGIAVTYDDVNGKLNFVAEVTQAELDAVSAAIPSTEAIQDIIGAMVTGNTETGITVTYQDADGTIDFEVTGGGDIVSPLLSAEISITTTATATISRMHVISGTTADYTVTLPAASGNTGKLIGFRVLPTATKAFTIDGNASETIDGATTRILWAGEAAILLCDGSNWFKIAGKSIPMYSMITASGATSVNTSTVTKVTLATNYSDNTGFLNNTTNSKITIKRPGVYKIAISVGWGTASYAGSQARCHKNGTMIFNINNANDFQLAHQLEFTLAAGDYLELNAYQTSGSSQNTYGDGSPVSSIGITELPQW